MPVAVPFIALALTAAGTGVAVAANLQEAKAAESTGKFNAAVEQNNALAAQQSAAAEAKQVERLNRIRAGSARASYGKAGVDLSAGNDVLADMGQQGELEVLSTLYAGDTQASYYQSRAAGERFAGRNARTAGNLKAAGSLIGGLANTAMSASRIPSKAKQPTFGPGH